MPSALEPRDAVDHHLETVLAKFAVLVSLEIFRHGVEHIRRHDRAELGKQRCVLARRAVHGDEPAHRIDERLPVGARLGDLRREFEDRVGEPPPGLMLLKEYVARLDELPGLAKMRENLLLLVALVIVLDEIAHDLRSLTDDGGIEAFVIGEVAHRGFIDE